ncbi:uncharacterized protein C8Q71DRAFT_854806 [Rhodofomes roseus]|uniref:CCHC-type domain-containing protein n=1 Tax=Rhodofomes roseus TaxID=34475 RepID=A0ABQ8KRD6_9APHY|nr:uncharacterized protein C8Q71DRAFT_854806 [Rhodofomes roseus]KAH9840957.1 hypothetical protein C8Q71DRAFT_854806 [Rhodofomes roseus]
MHVQTDTRDVDDRRPEDQGEQTPPYRSPNPDGSVRRTPSPQHVEQELDPGSAPSRRAPSPAPSARSETRRTSEASIRDMCQRFVEMINDRLEDSDEVIRNAANFANTALRDVMAAQQRAAETRNLTRTMFENIRRELDRLRYDPAEEEEEVRDDVHGPRASPHSSDPRQPSPHIRDDDYVETMSLDTMFAPRQLNESDTQYANRVWRRDQFLDRQGMEQRQREREARIAQTWREAAERHGGDPYANQPAQGPYPGSPDGDDDPDDGSAGGSRRPPSREHHPPGGHPRSQRGSGGPPPPHPPSGGPPDGDGGSDGPDDHDDERDTDNDDQDAREHPRRDEHRFTRSPSYLANRRVPLYDTRAGNRRVRDPYDPDYDDTFRAEGLRMIRRLVREKLSESMPDSNALKNIKNIPTPSQYDGTDDYEQFENWLKTLLRWMSLFRLGGTTLDKERLYILGQFLKGKAADWYNDTIDTPTANGRPWTFLDALCGLFDRFLHHATASTAADKFYAAKYTKEAGVNGLWDYLIKYAARMPIPPDDYTFARVFTEALPSDIGVPLFQAKNVSVESTPLQRLRRLALQQEHNNKQVAAYRAKHAARSMSAMPSTAGNVTARNTEHRTETNHRDSRGHGAQQGTRKFIRFVRRSDLLAAAARGGGAPLVRPKGLQQPAQSSSNVRGGAAPVSGNRPSGQQGASHHSHPHGSSQHSRKCFNCGEEGHFSKDCPHPPRTNFRAARIVDDRDDSDLNDSERPSGNSSEPPEASPDTAQDTPVSAAEAVIAENQDEVLAQLEDEYLAMDGSQYDPDEYIAMEDVLEEDESDDIVYYGSMRRIDVSQVDNDLVEHSEISQGDHTSYGLRVFHIPRNVSLQDDQAANASIFELEWRHALSNGADNIDFESIDNLAVREILRRGPAIEAVSESSSASYERFADDLTGPVPVDTAIAARSGDLDVMSISSDESIPPLAEAPDAYIPSPDFTDEETYALALTGRLRTLNRELQWTRYELLRSLERYRPSVEDRERIRERMRDQDWMVRSMNIPDLPSDYSDDPSHATTIALAQQVLGDDADMHDPPPPYPALRAMLARAARIPDAPNSSTQSVATRATVRRTVTGRRPDLTRYDQTCLTAYLTINGLQALVLLDSGSTTDSISPDFARVSGIQAFELENPAILQLGCVGSRSRINYGANVPVIWGTFRGEVYFDVVNLDRYDAVLGTPFMRKFGVCLDFAQSSIRIGQHVIPALLPREEEDAANRRRRSFPSRRTATGVTVQTANPPAPPPNASH